MTKSDVLTSALLAAVLGLGVASAATARPQSSADTYSRKVMVADLKLSAEPGARELLRRINRAANQVCSMPGGYDVVRARTSGYRTCVKQASSEAVAHVNSPVLTALYQGQSGIEIAAK